MCVCVCACVHENRCVLFMDQGYFRGGGPSSCPRCIGPFITPLSIFIATLLSSPIRDQLAVTGDSLHQSHTSLCRNIPTSHPLHPTLYNGFFFYFDAVALKNKGEEERVEKESCSYRWQSHADSGYESIDSLGNGCRACVVNGSLRLMMGWVEDEMMGG